MKQLPGYTLGARESDVADYRWITVLKSGDAGVPVGCNGCARRSDRFDAHGAQPLVVGGLNGFYDPQQGAGVVYAGGALTLSLDRTADGTTTVQDHRDLLGIIDGLRWTNGNGTPPLVSAEKAIL